jgi:hypothetical protein
LNTRFRTVPDPLSDTNREFLFVRRAVISANHHDRLFVAYTMAIKLISAETRIVFESPVAQFVRRRDALMTSLAVRGADRLACCATAGKQTNRNADALRNQRTRESKNWNM